MNRANDRANHTRAYTALAILAFGLVLSAVVLVAIDFVHAVATP